MMEELMSKHEVFPTHVGVYRGCPDQMAGQAGFPHTRGGVPRSFFHVGFPFSVFPTHVGVYLGVDEDRGNN